MQHEIKEVLILSTSWLPLLTPNLKNIKKALTCRTAIINRLDKSEIPSDKIKNEHPYGEHVKMIENLQLHPVILTEEEREQVAIKYQSGMTMTEIANFYGCHYTTIGRILRNKNIPIR